MEQRMLEHVEAVRQRMAEYRRILSPTLNRATVPANNREAMAFTVEVEPKL